MLSTLLHSPRHLFTDQEHLWAALRSTITQPGAVRVPLSNTRVKANGTRDSWKSSRKCGVWESSWLSGCLGYMSLRWGVVWNVSVVGCHMLGRASNGYHDKRLLLQGPDVTLVSWAAPSAVRGRWEGRRAAQLKVGNLHRIHLPNGCLQHIISPDALPFVRILYLTRRPFTSDMESVTQFLDSLCVCLNYLVSK